MNNQNGSIPKNACCLQNILVAKCDNQESVTTEHMDGETYTCKLDKVAYVQLCFTGDTKIMLKQKLTNRSVYMLYSYSASEKSSFLKMQNQLH